MVQDLRRDFHDRLDALRRDVADMAYFVVSGIRTVTDALLEGDEARAAEVVAADAELDFRYPKVEQNVFDLLALQSPVAGDLRFVVATLRIAQEIERSGDLVASVGKRVPRIKRDVLNQEIRALLYEMGGEASDMFLQATAAYAESDPDNAAAVVERDDLMDDLHRRLLRELFAIDELRGVEPIVELGLIARFYERIADHAVVVAERSRFIVLGTMQAGDRDEWHGA